MNWTAIGAIGELLGAAAVVVSLIYLGAQVRNQTRQARLEASRALSQGVTDLSMALCTDPEMADLWMRASADAQSLSPVEQMRYRTYLNGYFKMFEQAFLLHRADSIDSEAWAALNSTTKDLLQAEGVRDYLRVRHHWLAKSVVAHLGTLGMDEAGSPSSYLEQIGQPTRAAGPLPESA